MSVVSMATRTASRGGGDPAAALADDERGAPVGIGHRDEAAEQPQDGVLLGVHRVAAGPREPEPGDDQQDAQQVDEPVRGREDGGARGDEHRAEHDRAENSPEQQAVLVCRRHRERGEDQGEDEDVVDRERQFDEIAGEVLPTGGASARERDVRPEPQRKPDPDCAPAGGLTKRHGLGVAMEDQQIQRQHGADDRGEDQLGQQGVGHRTTSGISVPKVSPDRGRPWSAAAGHPVRMTGMTPRAGWVTPLRRRRSWRRSAGRVKGFPAPVWTASESVTP